MRRLAYRIHLCGPNVSSKASIDKPPDVKPPSFRRGGNWGRRGVVRSRRIGVRVQGPQAGWQSVMQRFCYRTARQDIGLVVYDI